MIEEPAPGEKLTFLAAAEAVLRLEHRPLEPTEITESAISLGILKSAGSTPAQTMKSKLSTDVLSKAKRSRFKRTGPNRFALREWKEFPEFVAPRHKKALLNEEIVVFSRDILRDFFPENGITTLDSESGQELIAQTFTMQRLEAEESYEVVQLVSQFLVLHCGRVATHKRTRRLPESRLHGVYSLLFGGHLNPDDIAPLFSPFDPVDGPRFITRELSEEVRLGTSEPTLKLVGGIYDPRSDVSTQHLGVLYEVHVPMETEIEIGERGFLQDLRFETTEEIGERIGQFENWSELVFTSLLKTGEVAL